MSLFRVQLLEVEFPTYSLAAVAGALCSPSDMMGKSVQAH